MMDGFVYSETRAVAEKKVLLCLLAMREVERRGIAITTDDVTKTSDDFRREFGLEDAEVTAAWMKSAGLDHESYSHFLNYLTAVKLVQESMKPEIEGLIELYMKFESVHRRG